METRQRAQPEGDAGAGKVPAELAAGAGKVPAELAAGAGKVPAELAAGAGKVPAELAARRREAHGCLQTLSHHSYWFDLWIFFLFDLVLLVFIYLLP